MVNNIPYYPNNGELAITIVCMYYITLGLNKESGYITQKIAKCFRTTILGDFVVLKHWLQIP